MAADPYEGAWRPGANESAMSDSETPQPSPDQQGAGVHDEAPPGQDAVEAQAGAEQAGVGHEDGEDAIRGPQPLAAARRPSRLSGTGRASWALAAAVCAAAGISAAVLGARSVARENAHSNATASHQSFPASSAAVASTLKLAIQHEEDLVSNASTFFAANPGASQGEFASWAHWVRALRHYPELERIGLVTVVPASGLATFQKRISGRAPSASAPAVSGKGARDASRAVTGATRSRSSGVALLRTTPPGSRSHYCLASAEVARAPARRARVGLDYCAGMPALLPSRGSGAAIYGPVSATRSGMLRVETPIYHGGTPPAAGAARGDSFVGWLQEVLVPGVILEQALRGHPGVAVQLAYHRGSSNVAFVLGSPQRGGPSTITSLHEGWTLQTFGARISTSALADPEARSLLIAGCLLSLLLGVLIYVLGTSRPDASEGSGAASKRTAPPDEGMYDELTRLPSRALTIDRIERTVARARRQSGMLAGVLLVDVDWFEDVNEKLGREAGDQLLRIVAERLEVVVRTEDSLGRLEADRFAIVVESVARGVRLDSLARRVIEALHEPIGLDDFGPSFQLTASIGVAYGRYTSHEQLLRDAELALEASKTAGKDRYTLFNANMRAVIEDRGVLEAELNAALREGQFFTLYQPVCDLRTRKVVALDALIRWQHPKHGVLSPADFLGLAEETGLAVPIGRWALQEACSRAAQWEVAGNRLAVGVPVSAAQFNRDGFATDVTRALQQSGVDASLVTLEVSEATVMADVGSATERMHELRNLGVRLTIDDFGSGYAYRSDLQRMPIDHLKVDLASLAASEDEDYRHWLLEAILVFARDLSLTVIAKGIDTAEQVGALQEMGCTLAQGHFFADPIPADALKRLFAGGVPTVRAGAPGTND
jgi:diguanylate cyclase (GGDEF)-like protein